MEASSTTSKSRCSGLPAWWRNWLRPGSPRATGARCPLRWGSPRPTQGQIQGLQGRADTPVRRAAALPVGPPAGSPVPCPPAARSPPEWRAVWPQSWSCRCRDRRRSPQRARRRGGRRQLLAIAAERLGHQRIQLAQVARRLGAGQQPFDSGPVHPVREHQIQILQGKVAGREVGGEAALSSAANTNP